MITPRIKCIIDNTHGNKIADIGTDHAYIPIYLLENNLAKQVIASDIKKGPADIAKENIKKHNLNIDIRIGDGLSVLEKDEVDTVIIAGMGGQLISEIINSRQDISRSCNLILQPMNAQYELRKYLIDNNFTITNEDIAIEGFKVYNIMNVKNGTQDKFKDDIEYHIPKYLINHKYYKNLYNKKHREFLKVIKGLENSNDIDEDKLNLYKYWLKELENYESL